MTKKQLKEALAERFPVPALFDVLFVLVVFSLFLGLPEALINWIY